jgi:prepilin-type N-terminal cleavage/methylation domain-containing protein
MEAVRVHYRPRGRGFSLIEVLLALVILTIGLYGVLDLIISTHNRSARTERRAAAIELARGKMAELQAMGYEWVEARNLVPRAADGASSPTFFPAQAAKFEPPYEAPVYRWQARFDRDPKEPDLVNVEVRVTWYPTLEAPPEMIAEQSVALGGLLVRKEKSR